MTRGEPDTDAIGKLIQRHVADPVRADLEAARRDVGIGMEAAADFIDEMAGEEIMLEMLLLDPVNGLRNLANALRKAVPR